MVTDQISTKCFVFFVAAYKSLHVIRSTKLVTQSGKKSPSPKNPRFGSATRRAEINHTDDEVQKKTKKTLGNRNQSTVTQQSARGT